MHLLLDSAPTGLLSNPTPKPDVVAIQRWFARVQAAGHTVYLPEIIDYELRRELVRARKTTGIARLDQLATQASYLPVTTDALRLAADLWAWSRNSGLATGDPKKLDINVILAAQALTLQAALNLTTTDICVVTVNITHLSRFVPADDWLNIAP